MSATKATPRRTNPKWTAHRTATPGVFARNGYFIVLTRPDGKHKVRHRFENYEQAVAFKATTPSRHSTRRGLPLLLRASRASKTTKHLRLDLCAYCGGPGEHIDHIVPRSVGGDDDWTNFTMACGSCNSSKGTKSLLIFLAHRNGCWEWRSR